MPWFRKHHACPCGTNWWDEWDCLCNDRCPTCDAEIEPDEDEAIQGAKSAKIRSLNDRFRKSLTGGRVVMTVPLAPCWMMSGLGDQNFIFKHDYYDKSMQRV
jgi:hypothetical protein